MKPCRVIASAWISSRSKHLADRKQVTIPPSLLVPNWLPGDPKNRISDDVSWPTAMGGQIGADFTLREQPNFQKNRNHSVSTEL